MHFADLNITKNIGNLSLKMGTHIFILKAKSLMILYSTKAKNNVFTMYQWFIIKFKNISC